MSTLNIFLSWRNIGKIKKKKKKICYLLAGFKFVCVEVFWPNQPNGVMSSQISLPNNTFTGQAWQELFVLRFYGPVNPMGSCRARSVYLTTHLLGRLSPLSG